MCSGMTSQFAQRVSICIFSLLLVSQGFVGEEVEQDGYWNSKTPPTCPTAIFNFGDSLSDTGNVILAFPFMADAENSPYGETFFGRPTGRFSDGRLVIDFLALALGYPLIDPYLQSVANDYVHGVNFAYAGATSSPDNYFVPFYLGFQVNQFLRFKNLALGAQKCGEASCDWNRYLPPEKSFDSALYTIAIGGNDILVSFLRNETFHMIIEQKVPLAVTGVVNAIQTLYQQKARNFLVSSIPPQGCSPVLLTRFGDLGLPRDDFGCLAPVNMLNQVFNSLLFKSIQDLRSSLPGVTISFYDYFSANIEILKNPSTYGFTPDLKFKVCCGAPGQGSFNYNNKIPCGRAGATACLNPDEYMSWDGIHFTEAFYRVSAEFILNGQFVDPPYNLTSACNLSFKNFGRTKYSEVIPGCQLVV